jgi:K+-transporting ATPase KdpF subunit
VAVTGVDFLDDRSYGVRGVPGSLVGDKAVVRRTSGARAMSMNVQNIVGLVVAVGLVVYLLFNLTHPE